MEFSNFTAKEFACLHELETKIRAAGRCHPETLAALNRLADLMRYSGRCDDSMVYQRDHYFNTSLSEAVRYPEVGVHINQLSIDFRMQGDFSTAELLLRRAIEIEERAYPPGHAKLPHRMNNLTAILLMQGNFVEVEKWSRKAWALKAGRHDITSERILFIRVLFLVLTGRPAGQPMGQLKTLLKVSQQKNAGNVDLRWDFSNSLEFYRPRISEAQFHFLMALLEAHNHRNPEDSIGSRFPFWTIQPETSLDEKWQDG